MLDANLFEGLKADGWSLNEQVSISSFEHVIWFFRNVLHKYSLIQIGGVLQAVTQQLEEVFAEKQPRPDDIIKAILDLDLKQVGAPCLPEDINRADSTKLVGPHILQLVEATDISRPTKFQETVPEDRKNRLLRLRLTDGSKACTAIEYTSIPSLHTKQLIPGVKIKIQNAVIRVGSLLLDSSKTISVLGGRVERLAAAWEVQQLYGGTAERISTKDSTTTTTTTATTKPDKPLPFKHFDAKATTSHEKMKKALGAVFVPSVGVVVQAVGGKNSSNTGPGTGPNSQQRSINKESLATTTTSTTTSTSTSDAAKSKLLERLSAHEDANGRYGRGGRGRGGGGRGRGGRRGRFNDDDGGDDGSMTLEEWEAQKKSGIGSGKVVEEEKKSDEQLARELQRQLDLEDMASFGDGGGGGFSGSNGGGTTTTTTNTNTNLQSELLGMFSYDQKDDDAHPSGGYGRGRGGRRGGGRGRGRDGGGGGARGRGRSDGSGGGRGRGPPSRGRGRGGRS
jgi:tudor domain-containing protein 3